ncbi:hypothetical protein I553_0108 [Mycobacterium xenopi 4042]|uniref:Uncharacterized protein n=1 Tax=Mycobacterium xenopi 4042 TaxID=1299334 RepID=X7YLA5_MYCXE|nr:hypothetical protein I553_0108 [Mycobacterium xenopi 4042]
MADLPFGFSAGDDPDRDKRGKNDPESGSGPSDAFGFGGDFDMADLGQLFTRLGQMFSGAGTVIATGKASGPVNYEVAGNLLPVRSGSWRRYLPALTRLSPMRCTWPKPGWTG